MSSEITSKLGRHRDTGIKREKYHVPQKWKTVEDLHEPTEWRDKIKAMEENALAVISGGRSVTKKASKYNQIVDLA